MTTQRLRLLAFAVVLALVAPSATALAEEPTKAAMQEAGVRFKKGLDLFKDGDFQAALIEFRRAYAIAPNYNVLYNIGQVYFQLQDYANALTSLEQYLSEGGANVPASRRADVQKDIDKLRARVAHLIITVDVPDAEITIDDFAMGKSPLPKPVLVSAGRHKVTVSRSGRASVTRIVEIASDETQTVSVALPQEPVAQEVPKPLPPPVVVAPAPLPPVSPPPPPSLPKSPPPPKKQGYGAVVAGWLLTGGFMGGAIAGGVAALGASSDLAALRKSPNATRGSLDAQASKTRGFAVLSDTMSAAALVAAGVSIYFTVVRSSDAPSDKHKGDDKEAGAPTVRIGLLPGPLASLGRWGISPPGPGLTVEGAF